MNFNSHPRPLAVTALTVACLAALTACTPHAGGSCNPKKDFSYFSTHTEHGKTTTTKLVCKQVGVNRYEWRKP
jgi:hypothetical protein